MLKRFEDLTHAGRARRLRPLANRALHRYGIRWKEMQYLPSGTNIVFRVETAQRERFVLRLTDSRSGHSPETIEAEIAWLHALTENGSIGVATPLATEEGEFVTSVADPSVPNPWYCTLFRWVPGTNLVNRLTQANVARHGKLSALLHQQSEQFAPPPTLRFRTYSTVFPYSDSTFPNAEPIVLFGKLGRHLMPPKRLDVFCRARNSIQQSIYNLFETRTPQIIHNDLHVWNVKVCWNRIYALDFEDLLWGHPVQDVATSLYYYRYRDDSPKLFDAFKSGYESTRPWPEDYPGQIEALIAGRALLLANFVAASNAVEYRHFAPQYLERIERRLSSFLRGA